MVNEFGRKRVIELLNEKCFEGMDVLLLIFVMVGFNVVVNVVCFFCCI